MNKMRMESPDLIEKNIEKIGELFPNVITETRDQNGQLKKAIDFEILKEMLSGEVAEGAEKYEFTWPGKKGAIAIAHKSIRKTLLPSVHESLKWDVTKNIYIEGDNLDALKILQESYLNSIKLIYIDPPYNTGSDYLIYNDCFKINSNSYDSKIRRFSDDEEMLFVENKNSNPEFHSDWCSMIYPRLLLARNLMKDDGLIYISIDEHELANLKNICDEVFGASNFITCISRSTGTPTGGGFDGFVNEIDYLLAYAKDIKRIKIKGLPMSESDSKIYDQEDEYGRFLIRPLRRTGGEDRREDRPTMFYPVTAPDGTKVYPLGPTGYESRWICSNETYQKLEKEHRIFWKKFGSGCNEEWKVYQKFYLGNRLKAPGNLWNDLEGNKKATREVKKIFDGVKAFSFPKPTDLIKRVIQISSFDDGDIVLDFFSGSATTAQALFQANQEDLKQRRFIMVQLPEPISNDDEAYSAGFKTISAVGLERIRRSGKLYDEHNQDIGFRVFKVADTNMKDIFYSANQIQQTILSSLESNIKEDRTDLDLLFGCLLDWGLELSKPYSSEEISGVTVHNYDGDALIACFAENIPEEVIREIARRQPLRAVFRDSSFVDDAARVNVGEIFKLLSPDTEVKVL